MTGKLVLRKVVDTSHGVLEEICDKRRITCAHLVHHPILDVQDTEEFLTELLREAGAQDGDEVTILARAIGRQPFEGRQVVLHVVQLPVAYAREPEPEASTLIGIATPDGPPLDTVTFELQATLDNERGEGTPPGEEWRWNHGNRGWSLEGPNDMDDGFYDEVTKPHHYFSIDWRWSIHNVSGKELNHGSAPTARAGMREAIRARQALPPKGNSR